MTRGTTPTISFNLPFDVSNLAVYYITVSQIFGRSKKQVLDFDAEDCSSSGRRIEVELSQEDTLALTEENPVLVQLRARSTEGKAYASKEFRTTVDGILKDGVI